MYVKCTGFTGNFSLTLSIYYQSTSIPWIFRVVTAKKSTHYTFFNLTEVHGFVTAKSVLRYKVHGFHDEVYGFV